MFGRGLFKLFRKDDVRCCKPAQEPVILDSRPRTRGGSFRLLIWGAAIVILATTLFSTTFNFRVNVVFDYIGPQYFNHMMKQKMFDKMFGDGVERA